MKRICLIIFFFLLISLAFPSAQAQKKILINEFEIESTPQSVELINIDEKSIDISGWYIDDNGGTSYFTIPNNMIIYPNTCLVFTANLYLNKSSADMIRLFDRTSPPTSSEAKLIDSFSYNQSPGLGISYIRLPDGTGSWITGQPTLGKFNSTGESCLIIPTTTPTPTSPPFPTELTPTDNQSLNETVVPTTQLTPIPSPTETPSQIPTPTSQISYNNIYLSEAMVYPESGQKEWIEIFNDNDFTAQLNNWYIDDIENGGSSMKSFSITIPEKGYGVFELTSSMFNNDGDSIRLLDFNKSIKDSLEYSTAAIGKTVARITLDSDEVCLQEPSKGLQNTNCLNNSPTAIPSKTPIPTNSIIINPSQLPLIKTITQTTIKTGSIKSKNEFFSMKNLAQDRAGQTNMVLGLASQTLKTYRSPADISARYLIIEYSSFLCLTYSLLTIFAVWLKIK